MLWEHPPNESKAPSLYTAKVVGVSTESGIKKLCLQYADDEYEELVAEDLAGLPHVRLPTLWPVACGSGDSCAKGPIDLTTTLDHNSACAVCCRCTAVFHTHCATEMEMRYAEELGGRPQRQVIRNAKAATTWLCPDCRRLPKELPDSLGDETAAAVKPTRKSVRMEMKAEPEFVELMHPSAAAAWPEAAGKRPFHSPSGRSPVRKRPRTGNPMTKSALDLLYSDARHALAQEEQTVSKHQTGKLMASVSVRAGPSVHTAVCALCGRRGSLPECEGKLEGPFEVRMKKVYAHTNCLAWAPESHQFRTKKALELADGEKVFSRARNHKCVICRKTGASLSCMYLSTKCCKGMHFRCALYAGAGLMVDLHGAYITFCPAHKAGPYKEDHDPVPVEHLRIHTPVRPGFFSPGRLCVFCKKDNFVFDVALLECATCRRLMHTKCALPALFSSKDGLIVMDSMFAILSKAGKFHCSDCAQCYDCHQPLKIVAKDESDIALVAHAPVDATVDATVDTIADVAEIQKCVSCNYISRHLSCPKVAVVKKEDALLEDVGGNSSSLPELAVLAKPSDFRCEMCRICKHCGALRVPDERWDENLTACLGCSIRHGEGHTCPVCCKAYRADEAHMIQCDGCDKWVHCLCCDLDEEEYAAVGNSDEAFFCSTCDEKAKKEAKARAKPRGKSKSITVDEEFIDAAGSIAPSLDPDAQVEGQLGSRDWDEESGHDVALYFFSGRPRSDNSTRHLGVELVPGIDLCRSCGSGGDPLDFRFCADCGEGVHGFCLQNRLPPRDEKCSAANSTAGTVQRFSSGGLGQMTALWRCERCAVCEGCGESVAVQSKEGSGVSEILSCSHCCQVFHAACFPRGRDADGQKTMGVGKELLCASCQVCELCLSEAPTVPSESGRRFCSGCVNIISKSTPCSVCHVSYPGLSPNLTSDLSGGNDGAVFAGKCQTCPSLVHRQCDATVGSERFKCFACVEADDGCRLCLDATHPIGSCKDSFDEKALLHVSKVHSPAPSVEGVVDSRAPQTVSMSNTTSPGGDEPIEVTSEDGAGNIGMHLAKDGACNEFSVRSPRRDSDDGSWIVEGVDLRTCELCSKSEELGDYLGRLLPWKRNLGARVVWAHSMCALWCYGMKRMFSSTDLDLPQTCFLVATEKHVYDRLRAKECEVCGKDGGSVKCANLHCESSFHLPCAQDSGCRASAGSESIDDESVEQIDLHNLSNLSLYCKKHSSGEGSELSTIADDSSAGCSTLSSICHRLNVSTSIRLLECSDNSRRSSEMSHGKVMLRTGALTVISPGSLVPNSALFLEAGALVATGYRAARRYWSLRHPGKRCLLLFEVTGTARTGPRFSIRFSDDRETVICASSASGAWEKLSAALEMRRLNANEATFSESSLVVCEPTFAFGLSRCEASVSLLESLPHSFLFKGRYAFQWRNPEVPKDLGFRVPELAYAERCDPHDFGAARVAGFLPGRIIAKRGKGPVPALGNVRTGDRFQSHAAMGLGKAVYEDQGGKSVFGAKQTSSDGRASKSRISGVGEDISRGRHGIANLPHAMQHRIMLKTWRRRTVVLRSAIEGWGVYATEDITGGEMVIEYMGDLIRPLVSDDRELYYDSKGIGCYMFELTKYKFIADATVRGNRARYINHSCDPNCFSRPAGIENNRRVIVIFAKRDIKRGEELCYDYQFPFADDEADEAKVKCMCASAKCVGFMN